jgi:Family of unknown function (DUF6328)
LPRSPAQERFGCNENGEGTDRTIKGNRIMSNVEKRQVQESLPDVVSHLLEECRMVLPGIQALFGFQLIAVFNQGFWERLDPFEQQLHLFAVGLVAIAVALVMTPAAYHRQLKHQAVSQRFVILSSRFLLWSMFPLMAAICLDWYVIAKMILLSSFLSLVSALLLFMMFVLPWFVLPRSNRLQQWLER